MAPASSARTPVSAHPVNRVASLTLAFWLLKILTTTVGDLSGDLLSITLDLGYVLSLVLSAIVMAGMLSYQFRIKRFQPLLYWLLILVSATLGAEISDTLGRAFHLGNGAVTLILSACWAIVLVLWYLFRGNILSSWVRNRSDECFYWGAVIAANSLGSVLGDLLGDQMGIGLLGRTGICLGILAVLWLLKRLTRFNQAILFWIAFVFTRIWF